MIARVFPRRTKASPNDSLAFFDVPGMFDAADEVHVSITFKEDRARGEWLAKQWAHVAPVTIGGPAYDDPGGEFVPGRYLRQGYVITSRGCPNRCWFCDAWRREGNTVRELEIRDGWNVLDSNLLACSDEHVRDVFEMLAKQPQRPEFTGGLDPARLTSWHVAAFQWLKPASLWLAYDGPEDRDALHNAAVILQADGIITAGKRVRCYVLIGGPRDTMDAAEKRLREVCALGIVPMAMLYRDGKTEPSREWKRFQRLWARPTIIGRLAA